MKRKRRRIKKSNKFDAGYLYDFLLFQTCIQFGGLFEDSPEKQWSSQIFLSELKKVSQDFSRDSSCLYQHSTISFSIFNPPQNKCLQFTLTSKTRNDIIIISIRERFCVHNLTGLKLRCFPVLCEDDELEVSSLLLRRSAPSNFYHLLCFCIYI